MLTFDRQGLIPVAIQDDTTNDVLMLAFMNQEAFELTRATGYTHFYSRSRNAIWRKGEQSGHAQEVRAIYVNCEENSLLIRVVQHGQAACHTGYRSCYYRQLLPDGSYETVAERIFDPEAVYGGQEDDGNGTRATARVPATPNSLPRPYKERVTTNILDSSDVGAQFIAPLESAMRALYNVYLYLRDRDLSEESNTSRLLHESFDPESGTRHYLLARLADELQELAEVQSGEHHHAGREPDTILEGSQVGYWLMLLAATYTLSYDEFLPHEAVVQGYGQPSTSLSSAIQECLGMLSAEDRSRVIEGLQAGFALIGRACAEAGVSPVAPAEYDLEQMRKKGLVE